MKDGFDIIANFNSSITLAEAVMEIQTVFPSVRIHCTDCLNVLKSFREAYRGYIIGYDAGSGKNSLKQQPFGRYPITTLDHMMEDIGQILEITFDFEGKNVCGEIGQSSLTIATNNTREWAERLVACVRKISIVRDIEIRPKLFPGNGIAFLRWSHLEQRLNSGEFDGGEDRSFYLPDDEP